MGTRFVLNDKAIWDNVEFEHLLFSESLANPDSYLPVKQIDGGAVSMGGWKIDVQSAIDSIATPLDVIDGYDKLSSKLKLKTHRSFLPFFTADIWNYRPEKAEQEVRAYYEPMIVSFLRLCYWYHKCDIISTSLEKKNKEVRSKLKVWQSLIDLIRTQGLDEPLPREWIRQAIGVIYELSCASLSHRCGHTIYFEKDHDFIFDHTPAEVKTKFPPTDARYGEAFYPMLNASLTDPHADIKGALKEAIKIPEILDNQLKIAIERQGAGIVFLNIILENGSPVLTFLSEREVFELTLEKAIDEGTKLLNDKSHIPLIVCFHAVHCNYTIFALMIPVPVGKENGEHKIDVSRL